MKKLLIILVLVLSVNGFGQILEPIKWETSVKNISDTKVALIAIATIESGWHLYSQIVPENGPIPTKFIFESNPNYLKLGNTIEGKGHVIDDPVWKKEIIYFENKALFVQKIRRIKQDDFKIIGAVEFMVCNGTRCLPPNRIELVFNVR